MNRRRWRQLVVCACIAGAATVHAAGASAAALSPTPLPAPLGAEAEPNDSAAQASPIMGDQRIRAGLSPAGDVDYYAFKAQAGDRVFANVVTAADTRMLLLNSDGLTPIEADDDDGTQFATASSIAGAEVKTAGTYYLRLEDIRGATAPPQSYDLYLALRPGAERTEEVEENNSVDKANALVKGQVWGKYNSAGDKDWFAVKLQAGDSVFLSLDLDPERDGVSFDGELGFGLAGDVGSGKPQAILTVDDPNPTEPPDSTPPSEAETMTVSQSGTYYGYVDVFKDKTEAGGDAATYNLAVTVFPASQQSCRTYSAPFGSLLRDGGTTTFPIQVDDAAQVARAALRLNLEADVMKDLSVSLRSPAGIELPIFSEIGSSAGDDPKERQTHLEATFDDFAAVPSLYAAVRPLALRPKSPLVNFAGQEAKGTWSIVVKDTNLNGFSGNLSAAELILCPQPGTEPGPPPSGGGSAGGSQAQPKPAQPPALTNFTITPNEFRAAKSGPMMRAKRSRSGGALVSYQSSEAVQTHFVLFELEEGRKVGRKCARLTASNSAKKPCVRPVKVITFQRNDAAGRNQFGFTGRVGARKLPPGEYQLQAKAYATSGLSSSTVAATFKVLAPAPARLK